MRKIKICPYCNKELRSEKEVLEHARKHAKKFYNPRFCSWEEALFHTYAAIILHSKDP